MTSPRNTNTPLDPALARWLEPLRELNPVGADAAGPGSTHAPQDVRSTADVRPTSELRSSGERPNSDRPSTDNAFQLRRAEHIQKLGALIRSVPAVQAKTRRRSQWAWGFAAAAALMVAAGGTLFLQAQPATVATTEVNANGTANLRQLWGQVVARHHGGRTEVLGAGASVGVGDELSTTAEGYASLDVGRVRVDLSNATIMELTRTETRNQAYRLRAGRVDVSVPHVPSEKQNVEVVTPNAIVRVRGTVFSVEVDNHSGTPVTRVQVTRGSVGVDHNGVEQVVDAGQSWSSVGAAVADVNVPEPEDTKAQTPSGETASNSNRGQAVERSSLREQNQLFSRALQAQRRGNHRLAAQLFSTLVKKYPDSPLGPSAQTELAHAKAELERQEQ